MSHDKTEVSTSLWVINSLMSFPSSLRTYCVSAWECLYLGSLTEPVVMSVCTCGNINNVCHMLTWNHGGGSIQWGRDEILKEQGSGSLGPFWALESLISNIYHHWLSRWRDKPILCSKPAQRGHWWGPCHSSIERKVTSSEGYTELHSRIGYKDRRSEQQWRIRQWWQRWLF